MSRSLACLLALALSVPALGQPMRAQDYLDRGLRSYAVGQYADAIADFRAGYELDPRPDFLYALAQAERMSGDCRAAVNGYHAFLRTGPPQRAAESARQNLARCEQQLAAAPPPASVEKTVETPPERPRRRWSRDPAAATLTAIGLALVGTGGALWGVGDAAVANADAASRYDDFAARQAAGESGEGERLAGILTLSIGGAAIVAGIARWAFVARRR